MVDDQNERRKKKEINELAFKVMLYMMILLVLLLTPSLIALILIPGFTFDFWIVFADGLVLVLIFVVYVGLKVYVKKQGASHVDLKN